MHFNVYIIDDRPDKTEALPSFLDWLQTAFPEFTFSKGFMAPNAASSDAAQIHQALSDPLGLVLLDAWMESPLHEGAVQPLQRLCDVSEEELAQEWEALHNAAATKLAAVIVSAARKRQTRVAYISNQQVDANLTADLPCYPNLPWFRLDDRLTWTDRHRPTMELVLSTFHKDALINNAIVFALSPSSARPDGCWEHNPLASGQPQNKLLSAWLQLDTVHTGSARALLLGPDRRNGWRVEAAQDDYLINSEVVTAVCMKLGIVPLVIMCNQLRLPTQPGLPFMMSLAALLYDMRQCDKFHAPRRMVFGVSGEVHVLRLELDDRRKDVPGQAICMRKFRDAFEKARSNRDRSGIHATTARLLDVGQGRVALSRPMVGKVSPFFDGVNGEVVGIEFDENCGAEAIKIVWGGKV